MQNVPVLRKKTSILIVNPSGNENKIIQIPTKILLKWKRYATYILVLLTSLIVLVGVFIYQKTSDRYKQKLAKANHIKSLIDMQKIQQSFKSIDETIYNINKFMDARGLDNVKMKNVGGGTSDFEITDINEIASYYESEMKKMEHTLEITPIGKPSSGEITSGFGSRRNPFTGYSIESHRGIDFKGNIGDAVKATASGIVESVGWNAGYGRCIIIRHSRHIKTLYGHLSTTKVKKGGAVKVGQIIGAIGSSGRSTGSHLHYEIINDGQKINPTPFLKLQ